MTEDQTNQIFRSIGGLSSSMVSVEKKLDEISKNQGKIVEAMIEHGEKIENLPCDKHESMIMLAVQFSEKLKNLEEFREKQIQLTKWAVGILIAIGAAVVPILVIK